MTYLLQQFDIDELKRMGMDTTGLVVDYPSTDAQRRALGIEDDVDPGALPDPVVTPQSVATDLAGAVPTAAPVIAPQMTPDAVNAAVQAVPAASAVTQEQLSAAPGGSSIMDAIFGPKESSDKFSNLNRQQRMMLAFGAIKDAGFALQGKEGNAFGSTLKAINDQIDMGRKAQAAQAQREALSRLLGPSGGSPTTAGALATPGDPKAELAQLESQMGAFAQMGQMDFYNQKHAQLTAKIEADAAAAAKAEAEEQVKQGKIAGYDQTISVAEKALVAAGKFSSVEDMRKAVQNDEFDPSSFFFTRQSFIPDTKEFKDFQSAANQFAAIMTFQNLGAIVDQGIKLGTLSDADLKIIGNQSGEIDPVNRPEQTAMNILQVYKSVTKTQQLMQAQDEDELQQMLKKYEIEG